MTLLTDYTYVDSANVSWLARKGSPVDGASIPRVFWTFIGGPFEGRYRNASVSHDVACDEKKKVWKAVHRMFYNHMLCSRVRKPKALAMYWAVYQCGLRWGKDQGTRIFPCGNNAKMSEYMDTLSRMLAAEETKQIQPLLLGGQTLTAENISFIGPPALDDVRARAAQLPAVDLREPELSEAQPPQP